MPVAAHNRRELSNRIRQWRETRGLSRRELADLVYVNVQTIGALERGQYSPTLYLAMLLAEALGMSIDELFTLHPEGGG